MTCKFCRRQADAHRFARLRNGAEIHYCLNAACIRRGEAMYEESYGHSPAARPSRAGSRPPVGPHRLTPADMVLAERNSLPPAGYQLKPGTKAYRDAANDFLVQKPGDLRPITVMLSDEVNDRINELQDQDGRERGFWVLGTVDRQHFDLAFALPIQTGDWSSLYMRHRDEAISVAAHRRCRLIGHCHSHPGARALPSPSDLDMLRLNAQELGPFVGLIVAARELGSESWDFHPWLNPTVAAYAASEHGVVTKVEPRHIPEWLAAA